MEISKRKEEMVAFADHYPVASVQHPDHFWWFGDSAFHLYAFLKLKLPR